MKEELICKKCGKQDSTVQRRQNMVADMNGVEVWVTRCQDCWNKDRLRG